MTWQKWPLSRQRKGGVGLAPGAVAEAAQCPFTQRKQVGQEDRIGRRRRRRNQQDWTHQQHQYGHFHTNKKKGKRKDPLDDPFSRLLLRRRTSTKESLTGKKVLLSWSRKLGKHHTLDDDADATHSNMKWRACVCVTTIHTHSPRRLTRLRLISVSKR